MITIFWPAGGDLNTFLPIVVSGRESAGTSDLSLDHLIEQIQLAVDKGVNIGIQYKQIDLLYSVVVQKYILGMSEVSAFPV